MAFHQHHAVILLISRHLSLNLSKCDNMYILGFVKRKSTGTSKAINYVFCISKYFNTSNKQEDNNLCFVLLKKLCFVLFKHSSIHCIACSQTMLFIVCGRMV